MHVCPPQQTGYGSKQLNPALRFIGFILLRNPEIEIAELKIGFYTKGDPFRTCMLGFVSYLFSIKENSGFFFDTELLKRK